MTPTRLEVYLAIQLKPYLKDCDYDETKVVNDAINRLENPGDNWHFRWNTIQYGQELGERATKRMTERNGKRTAKYVKI